MTWSVLLWEGLSRRCKGIEAGHKVRKPDEVRERMRTFFLRVLIKSLRGSEMESWMGNRRGFRERS